MPETEKPHLTFSDYQIQARKTALYPDAGNNFIYPTLGLVGEAGEVADKIKKIIRDNEGELTEDQILDLVKELGDVLWYLANLAEELGVELEDIAELNLAKLASRQDRGMLHGSGDNR